MKNTPKSKKSTKLDKTQKAIKRLQEILDAKEKECQQLRECLQHLVWLVEED